jgi:hypothetical protein
MRQRVLVLLIPILLGALASLSPALAQGLCRSFSAVEVGNPGKSYTIQVCENTPTSTPVLPTVTPTPTLTPIAPAQGILISPAEIMVLPMDGPAWNQVKTYAAMTPTVSLTNQDSAGNVVVFAKALVAVRTNDLAYRDQVVRAISEIVNADVRGGETLALGRELAAYVIAADLVNLRVLNPTLDSQFRKRLVELDRSIVLADGRTLRQTQLERPNNWGTMAAGSRAAIAAYLGDRAMLAEVSQVFKGWLGDRSAYSGFKYGDLGWQSNQAAPVGINPKGATILGISVDGAQPEEMRRGGAFANPPIATGYSWEALQGAWLAAEILYRAGFPDVYQWQDSALLRASLYLYQLRWPAVGDDVWQVALVKKRYGITLAATGLGTAGKNIGFMHWLHSVPVQ